MGDTALVFEGLVTGNPPKTVRWHMTGNAPRLALHEFLSLRFSTASKQRAEYEKRECGHAKTWPWNVDMHGQKPVDASLSSLAITSKEVDNLVDETMERFEMLAPSMIWADQQDYQDLAVRRPGPYGDFGQLVDNKLWPNCGATKTRGGSSSSKRELPDDDAVQP